jgi:MraZ protein
MLINTYSHNIDQKGRVFMPAKFREELGSRFIVCRGVGKCLFVFSEEAWSEFTAKLKNVPITDQKAQVFLRLLFASACECEADKQGRILISQRLRSYADLEKEVLAIGMMNRVELWSSEAWEEYSNTASDVYDETLQIMAELGI